MNEIVNKKSSYLSISGEFGFSNEVNILPSFFFLPKPKIIHKGLPKGRDLDQSEALYFAQEITKNKPTSQIKIHGKNFVRLIDTGADTSVIASHFWLPFWYTKLLKP